MDLLFLFCLVFAMSLCAFVYMCFAVTCWERTDLLALTVSLSLSHWYPGFKRLPPVFYGRYKNKIKKIDTCVNGSNSN